jgi:hypothetical protein
MSTRQSDRDLINAAQEAQQNLERVPLDGQANDLMVIALALFAQVEADMTDVVEKVDAESVEASESHVALTEAESAADAGYGDVYDTLVLTHRHRRLGRRDRTTTHMQALERYLDGNSASDFKGRARADKVTIMKKALDYVDEYTNDGLVPAEVIDDAVQAHQAFRDAYDTWRAEGADVTDARNIADTVRPAARAKYTSAREVAQAALRLSGTERPISDYCPSLSELVRSGSSPTDTDADPTPADDVDEPVEV